MHPLGHLCISLTWVKTCPGIDTHFIHTLQYETALGGKTPDTLCYGVEPFADGDVCFLLAYYIAYQIAYQIVCTLTLTV